MDEWIVDVISFQKIFGLCGLKGHIGEILRDVTLVDNGQRTTDNGRNVKIVLEFWKQNSQSTSTLANQQQQTFPKNIHSLKKGNINGLRVRNENFVPYELVVGFPKCYVLKFASHSDGRKCSNEVLRKRR